jgi:hypothetical protein
MRSRPGNELWWRELGGLLIVVHDRGAPTDERWGDLLSAVSKPLPEGGRTPRAWAAVLIYSLGGMPTVTQRARLRTLKLTLPAPPVALVSDSPLARGVLTAVRWIFPGLRAMRAFTPEQEAAALEALGLDEAARARAAAALDEMLGPLVRGRRGERSAGARP